MASAAERAALDRSLAEGELLNDITVAAAGEEDLTRLLGAVLARLRRIIPFTGGSIALVEGDDLVLRAAVGPFAEQALGQRVARGPARSWRIVETGQTFRSDDVAAEGLRADDRDPLLPRRAAGLARPRASACSRSTRPSRAPSARPTSGCSSGSATVLSGSIELMRRYEAEARSLAAAEAAQRRLAFLAEASVGRLGVARLRGDAARAWPGWSCRRWPTGAGSTCAARTARSGGSRSPTPTRPRPSWRARCSSTRRSPIAPTSAVARALETGESQLSAEIPDDYVDSIAQDAEHLALLRQLDFRSSMVVPLRARGRRPRRAGLLHGRVGAPLRAGRPRARRGPGRARRDGGRQRPALRGARPTAVRVRDHFLAAAAHDLKTPLTAIKVTAQLMGAPGGPARRRGRRAASARRAGAHRRQHRPHGRR